MKTGRGTEWPSFCSGICSCNLKYLGEEWLGFDHVNTLPDKPAVLRNSYSNVLKYVFVQE